MADNSTKSGFIHLVVGRFAKIKKKTPHFQYNVIGSMNLMTPIHSREEDRWAMATPRKSSEITKEWLEVILTQYEARTCPGVSVHITDFQVNPGKTPILLFCFSRCRTSLEPQSKSI